MEQEFCLYQIVELMNQSHFFDIPREKESTIVIEDLGSSNPIKNVPQKSKSNENKNARMKHTKYPKHIIRKNRLDKLDNLEPRRMSTQNVLFIPTAHNKFQYDILAQGDRKYDINMTDIENLNLEECSPSSCSSNENQACSVKVSKSLSQLNIQQVSDYSDETESDEDSNRTENYFGKYTISPIEEISERSSNSVVLRDKLAKKDQEKRIQLQRILDASKNSRTNRPKSQKNKPKSENHDTNFNKNDERDFCCQCRNKRKSDTGNLNKSDDQSKPREPNDCVIHYKCSPTSWSSQSPHQRDVMDDQIGDECNDNDDTKILHNDSTTKLSQATYTFRGDNCKLNLNKNKTRFRCCFKFFSCCCTQNTNKTKKKL